MRYVKNSHT